MGLAPGGGMCGVNSPSQDQGGAGSCGLATVSAPKCVCVPPRGASRRWGELLVQSQGCSGKNSSSSRGSKAGCAGGSVGRRFFGSLRSGGARLPGTHRGAQPPAPPAQRRPLGALSTGAPGSKRSGVGFCQDPPPGPRAQKRGEARWFRSSGRTKGGLGDSPAGGGCKEDHPLDPLSSRNSTRSPPDPCVW